MSTKYLKINRMRRVYVWELPVRIYHWLNVIAILVLIVTGFFIANPLVLTSSQEPAFRYVMGTVRFLHFVASYLFFFNFAFRIYWGFVGNKFAQWHQFIPTNLAFFKDMWQIIKIDILQLKGKEHIGVGHNTLAGFIYFLTFIAFLIQILTGFALYSQNSSWWFPKLFSGIGFLFGSDMALRSFHHWTMWFFILFTVIHIYLVFYHDYVEGRGEISSMGAGYKFIEEDIFQEHKQEIKKSQEKHKISLFNQSKPTQK
ncbi:Ni/Fe-hydrogenase, b-type cytochrome subunit [Lacihabitans sp. LS3-19]|uniref:Ni/Fe-hydrogenase, b-type cytochrome subunit n=1 Tax=Lacihabitans sp. LS3-19 TaxID=2487335 RepID=UPI0020CC6681|nr:Ni/Fe-hydrogenase, b-type cytochrome subunit [Lacihabitans sp. LS3-19]MCP9766764.1 Ni/Fe-hydrogenase, b-type cytochrome subunit [Lacihabitans sp. LS3-19]